jgi:hypothetical protein
MPVPKQTVATPSSMRFTFSSNAARRVTLTPVGVALRLALEHVGELARVAIAVATETCSGLCSDRARSPTRDRREGWTSESVL